METNPKIKRAVILLLIPATIIMVACQSKPEEAIKIDKANFKYNLFHEEDGLFDFEYKNNYEVVETNNIYFLRELSTGKKAFQIFEKTDEIEFDAKDYVCEENEESEVCYTKATPDFIVKNIKIFPGEEKDRYEFVTRTEALKYLLRLKYPEKDFTKFADDCFRDVKKTTPDSGYICYAKTNGIVEGIADTFYPESGINIWGTLKFLFMIFEEKDLTFDKGALEESFFEKMTTYHFAYEIIAKSLYEGIIDNEKQEQIWPNKVIYKAEFDRTVENFFLWQNGKTIRDYEYDDGFKISDKIFIKKRYKNLNFKKDKLKDFIYDNITPSILKQTQEGVEIYVEESTGIYEYLFTLKNTDKNSISDIKINYNKEKMKIHILVEYKEKGAEHYKLKIEPDDFAYMETAGRTPIEDPNTAPNSLDVNLPYSIPKIKIYMEEENFNSILENRSLNTRYPAYLKILYPGGETETHSILIKIRGNANRGYVKSSYTIESFDDFENGFDEIKLRSMIGDESLIREKLVYTGFTKMGNAEPSFSQGLVEINNNPFGFYQVTEAIKKDFFKRRGLNVKNWYYAQNVASPYLANLTNPGDEDIIKKHFEAKGKKDLKPLTDLIHEIEVNDPSLKDKINLQNIFDYTLFCYWLDLSDSYTHNYYLYLDENSGEWNMMFWDVDTGMGFAPRFTKREFKDFATKEDEWHNALIHYVFTNISDEEFDLMLKDAKNRWKENVDLKGLLNYYAKEYKEFFKFDNDLWNGRYLERNKKVFNTMEEIATLKEFLDEVEKGIKSM